VHHPGPEVIGQAVRVLETVSTASTDFDLKLESHSFGGCAIDATGEALPASTLQACKEADAILMGRISPFLRGKFLYLMYQRFYRWTQVGSIEQSTPRARSPHAS
jgi:hypothetical protein